MKSLVVMTYYQLMHAIALSFTFDEKPILYFSKAYLDADEELLDKIRDTGVFHKVIGITGRGELTRFIRELRKTKDSTENSINDLGSSLFDEYLEPYYSRLFSDADFDEEIYVYNDLQWHYYYIAKHFKHIIGVEDGYCSLEQQLKVHSFKKDHVLVIPFIDKGFYPAPLYMHEKVEQIISSVDTDAIRECYKTRLKIIDYNDLVAKNEAKFAKTIMSIFDVGQYPLDERTSLILKQPLHMMGYCSALDEYLLYNKYIEDELNRGNRVLLKPHPAEEAESGIYTKKGVTVLPKAFPVEVFNYQKEKADRVVTYGSTGVGTIKFAKSSISYTDNKKSEPEEIRTDITEQTKGLRITVSMVIEAPKLDEATYIDVMSCVFESEKIETDIRVVVKEADLDKADQYFSTEKIESVVQRYRKKVSSSKKRSMWYQELQQLKQLVDRRKPKFSFYGVADFEEETVFENVIRPIVRDEHSDYVMFVEEGNTLFDVTRKIRGFMNQRIAEGQMFQRVVNISSKSGKVKKITVNPGYIDDYYTGVFSNTLWHRTVLSRLTDIPFSRYSFRAKLNERRVDVAKRFTHKLLTAADKYFSIDEGYNYYLEKIKAQYEDDNASEEEKACSIANLLNDYYDWQNTTTEIRNARSLASMMNECGINDSIRQKAYGMLSRELLFEKSMSDNYAPVQDLDFYQSLGQVVEETAKRGGLESVIKRKLRKDKVKNLINKFSTN